MSVSLLLFLAILVLAAALVLLRNWRATLPLLIGIDLLRIGLIAQSGGLSGNRWTLLLVESITALSVGAILLLTALTFTRTYNTEQLDEFALFELRRSARRAQQRRNPINSRWGGVIVPLGALLLAGLATWLLNRAYPVVRDPLLDAAWVWILLCGLLVLITAEDVLKLGLGLLMLLTSAKLLYVGVAVEVNVLHIGLLAALSLLLALIVAYVSALLYGRLHSLEFESLYDRR